jgi:hypothetical protein
VGDDEKLLKRLAMPLSDEQRAGYYGCCQRSEELDLALKNFKAGEWASLPDGVQVWYPRRPSKWLPLLWYTLGCASTVAASIAVRFVLGG